MTGSDQREECWKGIKASSPAPSEPSYEQRLWDDVAKFALSSLIAKALFFDREGENGTQRSQEALNEFQSDMSAASMHYADAFMAERAKRMK